MKCAICQSEIAIEDDAVYSVNPLTLQVALFHACCGQMAMEELTAEERDRFNERVASVPAVGVAR